MGRARSQMGVESGLGHRMNGLHLTADLYECQSVDLLTHQAALAALCRDAVRASGLRAVADCWHPFPASAAGPGGITGVVLLAESHLAIHTWPERQGVTLDVYVCNFVDDNTAKAEQLMTILMQAFSPQDQRLHRLQRGRP